MNTKNRKLYKKLIVYDGRSHHFHRRIAKILGFNESVSYNYAGHVKSIKALLSYIKLIKGLPKGYDVFLFEGRPFLVALARFFHLIDKNTKVIVIIATQASRWSFFKEDKELLRYSGVGALRANLFFYFRKFLYRYIDGFICVAGLEAEAIKKIVPKANVVIVWPQSSESFQKIAIKYRGLQPKLNSHNLIEIVGRPDSKNIVNKGEVGVDLTIRAFNKVKREYPDSKLTLINVPKSNTLNFDLTGIRFTGKISDMQLVKEFKKSTLCVHPDRGAGGIGVLDSMSCGVPALISNYSHTKPFVEQVSKELIVPLNEDLVAEGISKYFSLDEKRRLKLSRQAIKIAIKANKLGTESLKKDFDRMLNSIGKNR